MFRSTSLVAMIGSLVATAPAVADPLVAQRIDREISAQLRTANVIPAGRADDATLVRRIYLDLLGRPPTAVESDDFFADPAKDKVHLLIDRLRLYPEAAAHWRRVIAEWLRPGDIGRGEADGLMGYLAVAIGRNAGWDQVARELLESNSDDLRQAGAADYLAGFLTPLDPKPGRVAATIAVASAFFGAQLQCAQCHDHPHVPEWTKARFDGLLAVFQNMDVERKGRRATGLKESGAGKKADVVPVFLDGTLLDGDGSPRAQLARHALRPEAPHFKRAAVNRVWKQLLGRGLVEPVDMIHAGNPASHPELFAFLADDFAANQFNLDRLIASIMHSEEYLRSARWTGPADRRPSPELFAVAELRPLTGPQMAWGVLTATGRTEAIITAARRGRAALPAKGMSIDTRYAWEGSGEFVLTANTFRTDRTGAGPSAGQAIDLAFGPGIKMLLNPSSGLVSELVAEKKDKKAIQKAYLAILCRQPTLEEMTIVSDYLIAAKTRTAGCQDLVWALLAGAEFRFNH